MFSKLAKELQDVKLASRDMEVEYFSKKAALNYIENGTPLNESIKKIAQENDLNDEYTKRVCEGANHQVSSHLFKESNDKNFEFPLADWEQILQPEKIAETLNPYDFSPKQIKQSYIHTVIAPQYLRDDPKSFYYREPKKEPVQEKTAETDNHSERIELKSDPYLSVMDLQESLSRAKEDIDQKVMINEYHQKLAYTRLYEEFKNEVQNSNYFKVAQALVPSILPSTLEKLTYDLIDENLISEEDLYRVEKIAHYNTEAPIFKMAEVYDNLVEEYPTLQTAQNILQNEFERVSSFLKNK